MIVDMNYWTKVIRKIFIFLLSLLGIYLSFKLACFYMPFLIAFIISLLLEPVIKFMMKKFKVSNMKSERGMVELRIIAGEPPIAGAFVVEPTLEDVFLYYFGEKGGEME